MAGGTPQAIGRVPQEFTPAGGAVWLEDGRIVFTTGGTGLLEIPAAGGAAQPLLELDPSKDADFHNVSALPGGRGLLYVQHKTDSDGQLALQLYVPSDGTRRTLPVGDGEVARPVYAAGRILFERGGGVWMVPFSLERLEVTGPPIRLHPDARNASVSANGTLVMLPGEEGGGDAPLTWVDRDGKPVGSLEQPGAPVSNGRVSPDGRFIAYVSSETGQFATYVSRFPFGDGKWAASTGYGIWPRWNTRGDRLYFVDSSFRIVEREVDLTTTFNPGRILGHVAAGSLAGQGFDVTGDGQRFLVQRMDAGHLARLLIVLNWR